MLGKAIARTSTLAAMVWLASVPVRAQQQQQADDPVADAARKARDQKKAAPKPKKVYTEDDFGKRPETPPATTPAQAQAAETVPAQRTATTKDSKKPPETGLAALETEAEAWRARFKAQRAKIAAAEHEIDILQREREKGQVQYYSDPQKALKEQNTRGELNDLTGKINEKNKQIAQLKQELSDMEDELRKSGGDLGWARE